jgi:hypothetical protein
MRGLNAFHAICVVFGLNTKLCITPVHCLRIAGSVSVYDVRASAGVGGNAMQLRVACERIGAAAFVNVGGGCDAVIAASDDGCVTMFDSRRSDLPLSIVEVRNDAAAICRALVVYDSVQVNDSVTCLASDGWSLLAGDSQGRLHVIEASRSIASRVTVTRQILLKLASPHCLRQVAGRCAGTCIDILKSHSQAILSINGTRSSSCRFSIIGSLMPFVAVCSDGVLTSSRDGFVRAWLPK